MWLQFIAQNIHFAANLFAALALAAICWLYLDAWTAHKEKKELFKWVGFGVLSFSFFAEATVIEQAVLETSAFGDLMPVVVAITRVLGYAFLISGLMLSPLQAKPTNLGLQLDKTKPEQTSKKSQALFGFPAAMSSVLMAIGGLVTAALYWRLATTGLERHFKRLACGFLALGISDLIAIPLSMQNTDDPVLYGVVMPFGLVWWLSLGALIIGASFTAVWVWSYLTKRFFSQLFMIFMLTSVIIFFVVSVSMTALLLRSVWNDALTNMSTAANVLNYALQAKQSETLSGAEQLAATGDIRQSVISGDHASLVAATKLYLSAKKQSGLMVASADGKVLLRAEDPDRWGDSISSDTLLRRALLGSSVTTVSSFDQATQVRGMMVRSAAPVRNDAGAVVGAVITSLKLDSAFVDGINRQTGLQSSIYAGDSVASTTLTGPDGKSRPTGTRLTDQAVNQTVLKDGKTYKGSIVFQNKPLLSVFLPLKDVDNGVVGMLMISQPQSRALKSAGQSIELNFMATALLIIVSILPIYYVAKSLEKQID